MTELEYELKRIPVGSVMLDPENPRFIFQTEKAGHPLKEEEMEKIILEDSETKALMRALVKEGVKDPIWVKKDADEDSKHIVIEGNRRITALRELMRLYKKGKLKVENSDILEFVPANIYKGRITEQQALLQRARLQTGKAPWGPFNEAAVAYKLRNEMFLEIEDIATELQKSKHWVNMRIQYYKQYKRFILHTSIDKPSMFSFFSEAPRKVRDWVAQTETQEKEYFDWIKGEKIPSAATKGGLRELPLVLEDSEAMKVLRKPGKKIADALKVVEEKKVELQMPLLKKLKSAEIALRNIRLEEIEELKRDPKKRKVIEDLNKRIEKTLEKSEP
jgi:hypothetical protein